ncbi:MAG: methylmalonyl-CoA mutase family protein [Rhodothermia bacterium]|nr:MAG: methylmalonyl-CoA mutase family protein [Rhodothermia bacterium]
MEETAYKLKNEIRFVTAASLFDGHDAAINIMRRILQAGGAEVIHLGHNRSVKEIVDTAIQEDAQGIAVSSYQGGHMEFFKYMHDLLEERGAGHIKVFGGGGGVIVREEIDELQQYGITRIFSPDDGMDLGLKGMIEVMLRACDFATTDTATVEKPASVTTATVGELARELTQVEAASNGVATSTGGDGASGRGTPKRSARKRRTRKTIPAIGVTGTGGAGKSTLTDELVRRFLLDFDDIHIAVLSVDPTRPKTGGALLGDRIRMNAIFGEEGDRVFMRSFATREANRATSRALRDSIDVCRIAGFDLIILETAGIGQSDTEIADLTDLSIYVMTQEFGAPTQLEKIGMLDVADFVALNKFEKRGSEDALRDVRKQMQRNREEFEASPVDMPVYPTMASHFNDPGVTKLYMGLLDRLNQDFEFGCTSNLKVDTDDSATSARDEALIPAQRQDYLGAISSICRDYREKAEEQIEIARKWDALSISLEQVEHEEGADKTAEILTGLQNERWEELQPDSKAILDSWDAMMQQYGDESFTYVVRGRNFTVPLVSESLSGLQIPRVSLPLTKSAADRLRFGLIENVPGKFPFTAGVFPFKREGEDPTRMFAGEGSAERTNLRFHLVSEGTPAKRLSTAFDSVTLYGFDPHRRPDIYGKVGNAGVSICTLDDMKRLYSGFDLCDPATSVSMTINGPAPMILAMFLNTAIDQQVEKHLRNAGDWESVSSELDKKLGPSQPRYEPYGPNGPEDALPPTHDGSGLGLMGTHARQLVEWGLLSSKDYERIRRTALTAVRGTVQADILKEDQAQNTCIFSTEFALRMMGDVQQYFVDNSVRNFYSVSISGYHIAEAGANPITQLAFTLSNGFTYVEYYLARGMDIDDFAPNLSFFFSNGMDPEYSVIGRVARRIWSIAMRDRYGANERSQKLKYHIQTSGRSLHAKEIQFNDIRTTLQALLAVNDNCNSLHTNAYDEAITTPTEESVRRAIAIQLIINRELGLAKNENPLQGSYVIDDLTDLVEEAVLMEFDRLNDRGGVLGAMETMYQRGKIQEESLVYERKKHSGELPVIGVNTFMGPESESEGDGPVALMRSTTDEKERQIRHVEEFQAAHGDESDAALARLQAAARSGENTFESLMDAVCVCTLGQITHALFDVGGQYRRNM